MKIPGLSGFIAVVTSALLPTLVMAQAPRAAAPQPIISADDFSELVEMAGKDPADSDVQNAYQSAWTAQQALMHGQSSPREQLKVTRDARINIPPPGKGRPAKDYQQELRQLRIVKHFRGPDGVPFPAPSASTGSYPRGGAKESMQRFQAGLVAAGGVLKNLPPLPACAKDQVIRAQDGPPAKGPVTRDVLYVKSGLPKEILPLLGQNPAPKIIECKNEPGNVCSFSQVRLNLRCLPTRIRSIGSLDIKFEGAGALKDFSQNENGILQPEVRQRLPQLLER